MEIILKQDVVNLGYKDDVVTVKDGYANNYLFPKGMAIMATPANKKMHEETLRQRAHKQEKMIKEAETLKSALDGKNVRIAVKVGENGQLFGSINNMQIADALKEQYNYDVDRKKIVVDGAKIKAVGNYPATVNVYRDIKAELSLEVVAEQ